MLRSFLGELMVPRSAPRLSVKTGSSSTHLISGRACRPSNPQKHSFGETNLVIYDRGVGSDAIA